MLAMLLAVAADTGAGGSPSPFSVNYGLFFWTIIVFVFLMVLLKRFAFPVILKATEEREATIARQLAEAEAANTEARTLLEENRRQLAEARSQAQAMLAEAKAATEKERAGAIERTRHEQDEILARARRDIAEERDKALVQLRREAVDLSLAAAAKLIGQRMDAPTDRAVVEGYLTSLEKTR